MKLHFGLVGLALLATVASIHAGQDLGGGGKDPDADYDRLDGTGRSGKRVNVIEWEGNLEIHVYPKGSLKGLALKIDDSNKDRPVMVIGYRFDTNPKEQLIRRNILSIDLKGFKPFIDPTAEDYDKVILSRNGLSGQVLPFKLDPEPTQLYPDGHPMLAKKNAPDKGRQPASEKASGGKPEEKSGADPDSGAIRPFFK